VATRAAALWHGRCGFAGGLGVARPTGTLRGTHGGCARQGGAAGFSLEMADGGGAEEMARRNGVIRRRQSSDGRGGRQ
jgi:hypothetical protein